MKQRIANKNKISYCHYYIIIIIIPPLFKKGFGVARKSHERNIISYYHIFFRNIDYLHVSIILFEVNHDFSVLATNLFLWIRHLVFRLECRRRQNLLSCFHQMFSHALLFEMLCILAILVVLSFFGLPRFPLGSKLKKKIVNVIHVFKMFCPQLFFF